MTDNAPASSSPALCVFCGAQDNVPAEYLEEAYRFGGMMAKAGVTLVYGAADCGMMGKVANGVLDAGGKVIGVYPRELEGIEEEHKHLTETYIVDNMHERKRMMYEKSDAFVSFPGGFGTLDETFETITWKQLDVHKKAMIIFNLDGYWDHLIAAAERIFEKGYAKESARELFTVVNSVSEILPAAGMNK